MTAKKTDWLVSADVRNRLGESALWHPLEQALYWIDYYGPSVHRQRQPGGAVETWILDVGATIGALSFVEEGLLLAMDHALYKFDPGTGGIRYYADPKSGRRDLIYNDTKVDRSGRCWVGTLSPSDKPVAELYQLDHGAQVLTADTGFAICNGPAFSPDNAVLYFSDTIERRILRYDLGHRGHLSGRQTFYSFAPDEGLPDGLAVDSKGNVWCALYGGAKIVCLDKAGSLIKTLPLPTPVVSSICFGGPDLKTLFVTTGWEDTSESASILEGGVGGHVFMCEVGVPGLSEPISRL